MNLAYVAVGSTALSLLIAVGCSAGGAGGQTSGGHGGAGSHATTGSGEGGMIDLSVVGSAGGVNPDGGRAQRCDDAGKCSCINVASLGKPAHYGVGMDNTDAFQTWLNTNSSASVSLLTKQTKLTPELLANYDVVILQALEEAEGGPFWQFGQDEVDALEAWVKKGGGLIALSGYGNNASEVDPTNQLLQFTGLSYNKDDVLGQCPSGVNCYCWGNSVPLGGWQPTSPISDNLTQIGAFHGHSINSADGTVVATDGTLNYGVAKAIGSGKVFVFADEWVTYSSQWLPTGQPLPPNPNDPCYDNVANHWKTADKVFQVPQFWYNAIRWVSPNAECFTVDDPSVIQ